MISKPRGCNDVINIVFYQYTLYIHTHPMIFPLKIYTSQSREKGRHVEVMKVILLFFRPL